MRQILVFSSAYYPAVGGAEIALAEIMRRTSDEYVYTMLTHRMNRNLSPHEFVHGVEVWRLGWGTKFDRLFVFPLLAFWKARKLLRRRHFDLMWAMMVSYASIGAYFCKLMTTSPPLLLTLQEGDPEQHLDRGKLGLLGFWWKRLVHGADYIQAISSYLADRAVSLGARGRVVIVPNGVDVEHFSRPSDVSVAQRYRAFFQITPEQRVVVTASRLVPKNAVDVIIRAIALLPQQYRLLIMGDGPQRPALEILAKNLQIEERISFVGTLTHAELPDALHVGSVFVRPSRSEGLGNAFLESMAAGLPVVATKIGGIADFLTDGHTGLVVSVDDPRDVAQKIERLFNDKKLYQSIQDNGLALVKQHYSWDSIAEQMQRVFTEASLQHPQV